MDLAVARKRLEGLLHELDKSGAAVDPAIARDAGELSHLDQHPAEAASELTDQGTEAAVRSVVDQQRTEVIEALSRLDDGTFGHCLDCQTELSDERLDARPEAARCVDCQTTMELAR
ncbi:MAG TPA: TraR/DksA C4-type zinc finger protein [Mycobacteriales bacterium]|nr:TraR/DksA C4-type zinc finger protein [Mycobacteriales bacterium]